MEFPNLNVTIRPRTGKGPARRLRSQGRAPAVLYGKGLDTLTLTITPKELTTALSGPLSANTILSLNIANAPESSADEVKAIVRDHQFDPVTRELLHVDFLALDVNSKFIFHVPLRTEGRAPGQQEGGTLTIIFPTLPIECLPVNIPTEIVADISGLNLNDNLTAADLDLPADTEVVLSPDTAVVQVLAARVEEEEPEEELEGAEGEGEGAGEGAGEGKAAEGDAKPAEGDAKGDAKDDAKKGGKSK